METSSDASPSVDFASIVPYRLLHSTRPSLPDGINPIGIHLMHSDWSFQLPGYKEHILAVQLRDVIHVHGKVKRLFQVTSNPGDIYLVPSGESAEYHYMGTPDMFILFLEPWVLTNVALQALDRGQVDLVVRYGDPDPFLHAIGQAFLGEFLSGGIAGQIYLETLTQMLTVHLLRHHTSFLPQSLPSSQGQMSARLRRVLDFIDANLHQDLTLATLAHEIHISPYHLARSFKQTMGLSLHQYIIVQRVERGRQMLETSDYTIAEVAGLIGFADHSHFTHHFKRRFGVTPSSIGRKRKYFQV